VRVDSSAIDVIGRAHVVDAAAVLNIIYRLEKFERVNSLDTLENLSALLNASMDRPLCDDAPDLLLDAALYMWDAHCKPLLRQIKIITEKQSAAEHNQLIMTSEEKRKHDEGTQHTAQHSTAQRSTHSPSAHTTVLTRVVFPLALLPSSWQRVRDWRRSRRR
jgi:hypothetical protein